MVTSYKLQVMNYKLQVSSYELRMTTRRGSPAPSPTPSSRWSRRSAQIVSLAASERERPPWHIRKPRLACPPLDATHCARVRKLLPVDARHAPQAVEAGGSGAAAADAGDGRRRALPDGAARAKGLQVEDGLLFTIIEIFFSGFPCE